MSRLPSLGRRGEGWFALQVVLLAAVAGAGFLLGPDLAGTPRTVVGVVGAALLAAGLLVGVLGIRDLDAALTPMPRPMDGAELVQDGIYRRLRHPIYAGVMASAVGWSLLTASLLALLLALALCALLDLKSRREEAWLRVQYADYEAYAARTRRFVPGIY